MKVYMLKNRRRFFGGALLAAAIVTMSVAAARSPDLEVRYGEHPRQAADLYLPDIECLQPAAPLAVFIHGGAWRIGDRRYVAHKVEWFKESGWAFASLGYRVLRDAPVEEQARDLAEGLRTLRAEAAKLGIDTDRIVLVGHSAGAHLAALLASDQRLLADDLAAVRAVILLDGAGYDIDRQVRESGPVLRRLFTGVFGEDLERQRALSPVTHVGDVDAPLWLIVHDGNRFDAVSQSAALELALRAAGREVQRVGIPGNHRSINVDFGTVGYAANDKVAEIMARVAGSRGENSCTARSGRMTANAGLAQG